MSESDQACIPVFTTLEKLGPWKGRSHIAPGWGKHTSTTVMLAHTGLRPMNFPETLPGRLVRDNELIIVEILQECVIDV